MQKIRMKYHFRKRQNQKDRTGLLDRCVLHVINIYCKIAGVTKLTAYGMREASKSDV